MDNNDPLSWQIVSEGHDPLAFLAAIAAAHSDEVAVEQHREYNNPNSEILNPKEKFNSFSQFDPSLPSPPKSPGEGGLLNSLNILADTTFKNLPLTQSTGPLSTVSAKRKSSIDNGGQTTKRMWLPAADLSNSGVKSTPAILMPTNINEASMYQFWRPIPMPVSDSQVHTQELPNIWSRQMSPNSFGQQQIEQITENTKNNNNTQTLQLYNFAGAPQTSIDWVGQMSTGQISMGTDAITSIPSGEEEERDTDGTPSVGAKQYPCPTCPRSFSRLYNLKSHIRSHQNHRPFECTECGARFTRNHDLTRHQKIHTKEKPYRCTCCGRQFARRDALKRHSRLDDFGRRVHCFPVAHLIDDPNYQHLVLPKNSLVVHNPVVGNAIIGHSTGN